MIVCVRQMVQVAHIQTIYIHQFANRSPFALLKTSIVLVPYYTCNSLVAMFSYVLRKSKLCLFVESTESFRNWSSCLQPKVYLQRTDPLNKHPEKKKLSIEKKISIATYSSGPFGKVQLYKFSILLGWIQRNIS